MRSFQLPVFNQLDLDDLEEYYAGTIELDGRTVDMDLSFDETSIADPTAQIIQKLLEDLPALHQANHQAILTDYENGGSVKKYIDQHLESVEPETLADLLSETDPSLPKEKQLLSLVHLKRVGFFPEDAERFVLFDYTIGKDVTDYLIAFTLDAQGSIVELTMEP
ncbi:Protein of unknown function [Filimonas lacunae]|uniref:DUF2004 domain-containing protein n=1 Tax=Filimonas lacunae TaxID=477680 RepID=A0A173MI12_9BACT|nr:DUF2004 domain-containing protein [Filimonas lacunae]BAV07254.1 hypothetical protein FLA_3277 [Filimonas lacunae]SIS92516.1 Protein of unknown function [Filimonas lacunae]